jgi:tetratricopeptide (TPR) repeat protein
MRLAVAALIGLAACGSGPAAGGGFATPAQGPTDAAIASEQSALRQNPADVPSLEALAGSYLQKVREVGDPSYYAKVEGLLKGALALKPGDGDAETLMGTLQLARHQFSSALAWGLQARAANPDSANALGVLVDAQVELGRYDAAAAAAQAMIDLRPDLSSYARVSYLRELHGDVAGAIDAMGMAVAAGGPVPENTAYTEVLLGNLYFASGRPNDADAAYHAAASADPGYVQALAGLAQVQAARGDYGTAIRLYRQAIDTYPAPQFVIALGDVYTATGDPARALQTYDLAAAEQQLYQASGVDLDAELALFSADHGRDLRAALAAARRAVRDRPGIYSWDALAWALFKSGDAAGALQASRSAHRLGTRDALFYFHTGMIEAALGDRSRAADDLRTALAISPHFAVLHAPEAQRELALLEATR